MAAMTPDLRARVDLMLALGERSDAIALRHFQSDGLAVESKSDESPVTVADRAVESMLREEIRRAFPGDAILGEEHGEIAGTSGWRWVVDPIDGTLLDPNDVPVLGVVSAPALGARWHGAVGLGAFNRRGKIRVSAVSALAEAQVSATPNSAWHDAGGYDRVVELCQRAYRSRGFGDFWQHMLVAEGAIDVAVDAIGLEPYDTAALWPILGEAGGRITDRLGENSFRNSSAVSTNGLLHDEVLGVIAC